MTISYVLFRIHLLVIIIYCIIIYHLLFTICTYVYMIQYTLYVYVVLI